MNPFRFLALLAIPVFIPLAAQAARPARVDLDVVEVRDGPGENYKILFSLNKGVGLASANVPIEGYYKIRALDGRVGWVPADSLFFVAANAGEAAVQSFANDASTEVVTPQGGNAVGAPSKAVPETATRRRWFGFRLLGGYAFFVPGEANALFGQTILQFGYNAGLEIGLLFSERFSAWIRAERIFQQAFAVPTSGTNSYQWDLSTWPVMGGFEFKIWSNRIFLVNVAALGGVGIWSEFSSRAVRSDAPNVTRYISTAFGGLARAGFNWTPTPWFMVGLQGGYRYLRTFPASVTVQGNGGEALQVNGQFPSIALDFSGPFAELVLGIQL